MNMIDYRNNLLIMGLMIVSDTGGFWYIRKYQSMERGMILFSKPTHERWEKQITFELHDNAILAHWYFENIMDVVKFNYSDKQISIWQEREYN